MKRIFFIACYFSWWKSGNNGKLLVEGEKYERKRGGVREMLSSGEY